MSSIKHLVYAVIRFLREQSQMDAYTSDEQESLEGRHLLFMSICVIIISQDYNSCKRDFMIYYIFYLLKIIFIYS